MADEEMFAFLGVGASFDKRSSVAKLFTRSKAPNASAPTEAVSKELDFFHEAPAPAPSAAVEPTSTVKSFTPAAPASGNGKAWRKGNRVNVEGDDVPLPMTSFHELKSRFQVKSYLCKNMLAVGWVQPTAVQAQAIPVLMGGRDVIACAPTGSGKTAAFVIPLMHRLRDHKKGGVRGLVLCPTRELAHQTFDVIRQLSRGKTLKTCLLNSSNAKPERWKDGKGRKWDIIVATPMRLLHLLHEGVMQLDAVEFLVLDEADRLFETDFLEQADAVFSACSSKAIVRAMFSATVGEKAERLARNVMFSPVRVIVGARAATLPDAVIHQELVYVGREQGKMTHFRQMVHKGLEPPVLVFMQNRERAMDLFHELIYDGINVDVLTADRTQAQRDATVKKFREGTVWVLITTDVLGRGMDFKGINVVVNWDMPKSVPDYIHRIGRTGRAGRPGRAITYYEDVDVDMAKRVSNLIKGSGGNTADWLLKKDALKMQPGKKQRKSYDTQTVSMQRGKIRSDAHLQATRKKRERPEQAAKDVPAGDGHNEVRGSPLRVVEDDENDLRDTSPVPERPIKLSKKKKSRQ